MTEFFLVCLTWLSVDVFLVVAGAAVDNVLIIHGMYSTLRTILLNGLIISNKINNNRLLNSSLIKFIVHDQSLTVWQEHETLRYDRRLDYALSRLICGIHRRVDLGLWLPVGIHIVIILAVLFVRNLLWAHSTLRASSVASRILFAYLFSFGLLMTIVGGNWLSLPAT